MSPACFFCGETKDLIKCQLCDSISFCGRHEQIHKAKNGASCYPWLVETRPGVGRMVVASRDIACHEFILHDDPVALSPTQAAALSCLTCHKLLEEESAFLCQCGFHMCNAECAGDARHRVECTLFVGSSAKSSGKSDFPLIMPLRLLAALEDNPVLRDKVSRLMDHQEDRMMNKEEWQWVEDKIVKSIMMRDKDNKWSEDDIQKSVGLIRTNGCCAQDKISGDGGEEDGEVGEVRMLYPSLALFSHSCAPNTQTLHQPHYGIAISSTKAIPRGEEITITYTDLLGSSIARKKDIQENWFFQCQCQRCLSPDDFGSNTDSWKCDVSSCGGWIKSSADQRLCCDCGAETEKSVMNKKEKLVEENLMKIINNSENESHIQNIQTFMQEQELFLHQNHWLMTLARISLVNKNVQNGYDEVVSDLIIENCNFLISLLDNLQLGDISARGFFKYQMSVQSLNKLTQGFESGEVDKVCFEKGLLELEPLLKSCIVCLQQESERTHKRLLAHRAELMLANSREMIMFLEFL